MQEMNASDWLRVLGKGFVVLLPLLAIWAYIWLCPMAYVDREQVAFFWTRDFIRAPHGGDYDVVCLGDSVASSAYAPELLSEKTVNLALPGQTPVEQYYVLKTYLKHHPAPKVCYLTFLDGHLSAMESSFYWRTLCSQVLDWEDEREIFRAAAQWEDKTVLKDNYQKEWLAYRARFLDKHLPSLLKSAVRGRRKTNRETYAQITRHRGTYYTRGLAVSHRQKPESKPTGFKMGPMTETYYRKLLALCKEHRIRVRIVHVPRRDVIYSEAMRADFDQYAEMWKKEELCADVSWIETGLTAEGYADFWHLNNHGSYKFSKRVKAMYPEDFADDTPASRATVEGILDYIRMESRPDMLLKWIEDKPLTAVCFLRTPDAGKSDAAFADALCAIAPGARAEAVSSSGTRCLVLRGVGPAPALASDGGTFTLAHPAFAAPLRFIDETYAISAALPGEKAPRPIVKSHATALSVVILDDQTQAIAAVKNFLPLYGHYELMD